MSKHVYAECKKEAIPAGVRFDTPGHHQGQIVEVSYGGFGRHVHDKGDPYKRVIDHSDGSVWYGKLDEREVKKLDAFGAELGDTD